MSDEPDYLTPQGWTTAEMQEVFEVLGFTHGFVVVIRKSDGVKGSLSFAGRPRIYTDFVPA